MKYRFQLSLVCFIAFQLGAQELSKKFTVSYGQVLAKDKENATPMAFFKSEKGYIGLEKAVIHGPQGYNYFIETYDENLKSNTIKKISDIIDEKNYTIEDVFRFNNKFIIETSRIFPQEKREETYLQLINPIDGSISERQLIANLEYTKKKNRLDLVFSQSPNEKNLLVSFIYPSKTNEEQKIGFEVFDEQLKLVWKKEQLSLMVENRRYDILKTVINDNKEVYLLGKNLTDAKVFSLFGTSIYRTDDNIEPYEILNIVDGKLNSNLIKVQEIGLLNFTIEFGRDNVLRGYGYYSDSPNNKVLSGIFSTNIDPKTGQISSFERKQFDMEMLKAGLSEKAQAKMDKKAEAGKDMGYSTTLKIKEIVLHNDSSQSFVGEVYYVYTTTVYGANGSVSVQYHYVYGDLIIARISQSNEITNINKVIKYSVYGSPIGNSLVYNVNNKLAAIFPDTRKNYYLDNPSEYKDIDPKLRKNSAILSVALVYPDGKMERNCVIDYYNTPEHTKDAALVSDNNAFLLENSEVILGRYFRTLKCEGLIRITPNE